MKRLHLFEAVGLVDDRLVEEAADAKRTAQPWSKWLAAAACVALALSLGTAAAGTLLRGCGSKSTGAADMAAPAEAPGADMAAPAEAPAAASTEAAVSEEVSPEMEDYEGVQVGAEPQAAAAMPEQAAGQENAPAEPEEPLPEPAGEPANPDGIPMETGMGAIQKAPELYAASGEIVITRWKTEVDRETNVRRVWYQIENQSAAERTETLHFTLDTGEKGMEGWNLEIRIDGETVSFDAHEAVGCPAADGSVPEDEGRHFLIEFAAALPAKERVEVEIQY